MTIISKRRFVLAFVLTTPLLALSACEIPTGSTGGSVYYDALLWNDYYGRPGIQPPPPGRPVHPIAPIPPRPPVVRPPVVRPPIARPPVVRPPIARPSRGRF